MLEKIVKLLKNPLTEYGKIIPYITYKLKSVKRNGYELFGNGKFSTDYAGHNELLKYVGYIRDGFFIECGGNDGWSADPTYYLEKIMSWRGIIIEPLAVYKKCARRRKKSLIYNYALVADDYSAGCLTLMDCNLMSVVKGVAGYDDWVKNGEEVQRIKAKEITVPVITLNKLLDEYYKKYPAQQIDLLVIDVEGYELEVLRGINLSKYQPRYILVEAQTAERKESVDNYLLPRYEWLAKLGHADYLYKLPNNLWKMTPSR